MTVQNATRPRHGLFEAALARIAGARRTPRDPGTSGLRNMLLHRFAAKTPAENPDPVLVAVLAIDRVGPAAVRACASGVEVRVSVGDEATAAVLRAALAQTARRRPTDRLIRVVSD